MDEQDVLTTEQLRELIAKEMGYNDGGLVDFTIAGSYPFGYYAVPKNRQVVFQKTLDGARIPEHSGRDQHSNVGLDFFAAEETEFSPTAAGIWTAVVNTGVRVALPHSWHLRMASRSGLAFKQNTYAFPGTIDSSYRGDIMVQLVCFSDEKPDAIKHGSKISQGVIFRSLQYEIVEGEVDTNTERGEKGFGSSGM